MQKDHLQSKDQVENKPPRIQSIVNRISLYFGNVLIALVSFSEDNVNNKEYNYIRSNIRHYACMGIKYISVQVISELRVFFSDIVHNINFFFFCCPERLNGIRYRLKRHCGTDYFRIFRYKVCKCRANSHYNWNYSTHVCYKKYGENHFINFM